LAWSGADHTMTHIAIQEQLDGKVVDWMEKVATNNTAGDLRSRLIGYFRFGQFFRYPLRCGRLLILQAEDTFKTLPTRDSLRPTGARRLSTHRLAG